MVPAPPVPPSPTIATPSAADPGALLERAADEALRLVRADGAFACLIDGPGTVLRFAGEAGTGSRRERAWASALADPANSALTRRAVAERRLTATSDYRTDATFDSPAGSDAAVGRLGLRSLVVVPLVGPEDGAPVMGALGVFADEPAAFDEARIALVQALADHCAASLANARLIAELASSREELARTAAGERALREISSRLVAITSPGELLQRVVEAASRLVDADGAILALLDRHERVLRWSYDDGLSAAFAPEYVASLTLPIGVGPTGEAVAAERIVVVGEDLIDRFPPSPESDHFFEVTGFRSMIAAPIVGDGRPLGALEVYSKAEHAFDEAQAAQIEALAGQAAIALTNARLVEELARSRERLAQRAEAEGSLREIASRISAIRDPDAVLQYTLDEAVRLLGSDGGRIALIDDASGDLAWAYSSGAPPLDSDDLSGGNIVRREGGISGRAIADGRAFFTSDYLVDPRFVHGTAADAFVRNAGIRAAMAAPIVSEGRPLGAINLHAFRPGAYDETAASLLEALASQAAIAVSNAQLIRELGRSREENARRAEAERALREIATRLTAVRDPGELLQLVVTEAARLLSAERSQIDLIDATTGLLRWAYPREMQLEAEPAETNQSRQTGVAGRAIEIGGAFVTGDYLGDERFVHTPESDDFIRRAGLLSVIAAPLVDESGVLGVLNVGSTRRDAFGPDDAALIEALATQAALAISNARRIELLDASRAALVHRADAERSLREIASRLASYRAPAELLQYTIDAARRLLGADGGLLDLLDPATGMISWAYDSGVEDEKVRDLLRTLKLPVGSGLFGTAIARGEVVATGDYLADDRFVHMSGADAVVEAIGFRALVAAPLQGDSGPLGVLGLFSARPNAFAEADLALLAAFADAAAVAITNARLIEELNRSRSELARRAEAERTLREITARITVLHDQREVLQQVVDESKRLLGSDGAHLTLMLDDRRSLQPVVVAGGTDEESDRWLKGQRFPVGGGMNGLAAELNQPISTVDYLVDPRIPHEPDDQEVAQRLGLRAMAVAPLRALEGEVIGTLAISYDEPRAIADEELQLLQGLADQAAIAVTNLRLYDLQAESETRYRHLVQNSPDLVWAIDGEGRFTFVSDTCERLTGWQPDDLLGQHFGALVHPDSDDVALRDWTEGAVGPVQELRGRLGLRHRDGRAVPAEFNALARYEDGRFVGANGAVRDMTELDRLERELRESEARYRSLVQSSPDLIFATDPEGRYEFVGNQVSDVLGWQPDHLIGRGVSEFVAPESAGDVVESFDRVAESPTTVVRSRVRFRAPDGRSVPFEINVVGSVDDDGRLESIHGVARDVSERERLERELRESETRYRFLVENSPDIVYSTDAEGLFTYVSDTTEHLLGWSPADIVGKHFSVLVAPHSMPAAIERWQALVDDPSTLQNVVLDLVRRDGGLTPFDIVARGAVQDGTFVGIHGASRDISERERLERELRGQAAALAASEERAHLARELHDSVTQGLFSMTLLTRSIELLLRRDPDAAADKLGVLRELQRDALAETRALIFELRPSSLAEEGLVKALRTHTAAVQGRIGLPVVLEAGSIPRLPIDTEDALYRIAQEALHNVIKHANARQVRIELAHEQPWVRVTVEDDGLGFDETAVPSGHLGLAGMRARTEKVGGRLTVRSAPGQGTRIEASVPDGQVPAGEGTVPEPTPVGTDGA